MYIADRYCSHRIITSGCTPLPTTAAVSETTALPCSSSSSWASRTSTVTHCESLAEAVGSVPVEAAEALVVLALLVAQRVHAVVAVVVSVVLRHKEAAAAEQQIRKQERQRQGRVRKEGVVGAVARLAGW